MLKHEAMPQQSSETTQRGQCLDFAATTPIEDPRHPVARRIADVLRSSGGRSRTIVIDDVENIATAVQYGVVLDSVYCAPGGEEQCRSRLGSQPTTPLYVLSNRVNRSLFGKGRRSRVFALAKAPRPRRLTDLHDRPGDIVILDGVRTTGNIGAITRSACAFGAAGVVLVDSDLSQVSDRRLIRASRALVFALPVILAAVEEVQDLLQSEQVPLVGLKPHASTTLRSIHAIESRLGLLLGSERSGASTRLEGMVTQEVAISMTSGVESLNVSVAAAIALHERRGSQASH